MTGIPSRYRKHTLADLPDSVYRTVLKRYVESLQANLQAPKGILFFGPAGTGKSTALGAFGLYLDYAGPRETVWFNCADVARRYSGSFKEREGLSVVIERSQHVVVLDDVQEAPPVWLTGLVSQAYDAEVPIFYTGNLDVPVGQEWDALAQRFGPVVARRMRDECTGFAVIAR